MDVFELLGKNFGTLAALGIGIIIFILLISLSILVFAIIVSVKFYKKCGYPGWAAIVPGYNTWIMTKISGLHWIYFAVIIAAIFLTKGLLGNVIFYASIFANICMSYNIALKFKKEPEYTIGLVLLPIVFISILALSNKEIYDKNVQVKNGAFFDINF